MLTAGSVKAGQKRGTVGIGLTQRSAAPLNLLGAGRHLQAVDGHIVAVVEEDDFLRVWEDEVAADIGPVGGEDGPRSVHLESHGRLQRQEPGVQSGLRRQTLQRRLHLDRRLGQPQLVHVGAAQTRQLDAQDLPLGRVGGGVADGVQLQRVQHHQRAVAGRQTLLEHGRYQGDAIVEVCLHALGDGAVAEPAEADLEEEVERLAGEARR